MGPKLGKVWSASDQELDWSSVNPQWVTELVAVEKIIVDAAQWSYMNCVHNAKHHIEQLQYVVEKRKEYAADQDRKKRMQALFDSLGELKPIPAVLKWKSMLGDGAPRHKVLVLCGPSGMGKSLWG